MSSCSETKAPAAAKAPAKTPKEICKSALRGACHFGPDRCRHEHPADPKAALAAYESMAAKSTTLCAFYPKCTKASCTFLHAEVLPKLEPEARPRASQRRDETQAPCPPPGGRPEAASRQGPRGRGGKAWGPPPHPAVRQARQLAAKLQNMQSAAAQLLNVHRTMPQGGFDGKAQEIDRALAGLMGELQKVNALVDASCSNLAIAPSSSQEDEGDGGEGDEGDEAVGSN